MTNRDKAIYGAAWALILSGIAVILVLAIHPVGHGPRSCTFDGGGTIASGDAARTSEGTVWVCTDGTLVHVAGYGN